MGPNMFVLVEVLFLDPASKMVQQIKALAHKPEDDLSYI